MITSTLWQQVESGDAKNALQELADALAKTSDALDTANLKIAADEKTIAAMKPYLVPTGGIVIYLGATCPDGFTESTALQGSFPMGTPALGTVGTVGGLASYTPTITSTTGTPSTTGTVQSGTGASVAASNHGHAVTSTSDAVPLYPPFVQVLFCEKS